MWHVVKKLLIISHGQATVERGFSINSELIVENMAEKSVVAQRQVYDGISHYGAPETVSVTKSMLTYTQGARQRYIAYLDQQKESASKQKLSEDSNLKRKHETDRLRELKSKRQRLATDIISLQSSADEFSEKCESTGDLSMITKANSFRRSVRQKESEIETIDKEITKLSKK